VSGGGSARRGSGGRRKRWNDGEEGEREWREEVRGRRKEWREGV